MMQAQNPAVAQPQVLSTDDIQRLLEENYVFIKAVVEQQNLGRVQEMQQYQQKLQQNLMLLAAVADAQPHSPAPPIASLPASLNMQSIPALQGLSLQGMSQPLPASSSSLPLYNLAQQQQLLQLQAQQQAQLNGSLLSQPAIAAMVAAGGLPQQQQQQQQQQPTPQQLQQQTQQPTLQLQQQQLYAASQNLQAAQPQAFS